MSLIVTLMCGLPRCGKSTWIKENKKDEVVVSPDDIRNLIFGHRFHKKSEDFIWSIAKAMARLLLYQDRSIIIDATNMNSCSRWDWIFLAKEFDAKVRIVWIKTSLKECLKRNTQSPDGCKLPENTLIRMAGSFIDPKYDIEDDNVELIEIPKKNRKSSKGGFYQKEYFELMEAEK